MRAENNFRGDKKPEGVFPDHHRTTRTHAGEAIEDAKNWPGMVLVGVGIVLVALTLTAAGYGFEGWAIVAGIAAGLSIVIGAVLVFAEHKRVQRKHGDSLYDDRGH
ncbi:hypothetical protein [Nocardia bhagyanarayanae]|uniref:UsfY protein n=1 Tax=Nocardia bhagyanarayanae TaxID=1215925 RepID=A0A543FH09_9NOCA|nr:hypothetical protein [Nocardia bhagyanarayanae]TQM33034.1 hypothetical protein FB390_4747 [Nocardia bhagyanarayanae]